MADAASGQPAPDWVCAATSVAATRAGVRAGCHAPEVVDGSAVVVDGPVAPRGTVEREPVGIRCCGE